MKLNYILTDYTKARPRDLMWDATITLVITLTPLLALLDTLWLCPFYLVLFAAGALRDKHRAHFEKLDDLKRHVAELQ